MFKRFVFIWKSLGTDSQVVCTASSPSKQRKYVICDPEIAESWRRVVEGCREAQLLCPLDGSNTKFPPCYDCVYNSRNSFETTVTCQNTGWKSFARGHHLLSDMKASSRMTPIELQGKDKRRAGYSREARTHFISDKR